MCVCVCVCVCLTIPASGSQYLEVDSETKAGIKEYMLVCLYIHLSVHLSVHLPVSHNTSIGITKYLEVGQETNRMHLLFMCMCACVCEEREREGDTHTYIHTHTPAKDKETNWETNIMYILAETNLSPLIFGFGIYHKFIRF